MYLLQPTVALAASSTESNAPLPALLLGGLVGMVAVGWWTHHRYVHPLRRLQRILARQEADGPATSLRTDGAEPVQEVAAIAERLLLRLRTRLHRAEQRNAELTAVLAAMRDAVLAVDQHGRIIQLNQAAMTMFGQAGTPGQSLEEVVRHPDLLRLIQRLARAATPASDDSPEEVQVHLAGHTRHLQVQGAPLRDADNRPLGALVVLADTTRMRQLERMRTEFAANVSHELKTPITAIKGSVETLLAGAMDEPQARPRFLEILKRHSDRLEALVSDTLSLSNIEQQATGHLDTLVGPVVEVLRQAVKQCELLAEDRHISLTVDCPESLQTSMDATLLEQAVVNLLQNAIAYSPPGATVTLSAYQDQHGCHLQVTDTGTGIADHHQDRLFERFYRVDPSRVRSDGGTGLGLAIVKHIAQSHGGTVTVRSAPGKGSTFTISLPPIESP